MMFQIIGEKMFYSVCETEVNEIYQEIKKIVTNFHEPNLRF